MVQEKPRELKPQRRSSSQASCSSGTSAAAGSDFMGAQRTNSVAPNGQDLTPGPLRCFLHALARKKPLDCRTDTNLNRCLNLVDLTALGVGSTLGLGLYVLAGQVASNKAGPAVVISFALAALASAFSALCYAEFAGRVPRAGSAYAYSYISVGEFVAFVIGWNLVLEYVIGASSVARGFSGYLRFVYEHALHSLSHQESSNNNNNSNPSEPNTGILQSTVQPVLPANLSSAAAAHSMSMLAANLSLLPAAEASQSADWLTQATDYLVEYFDWPSVAIIALITAFILFGVKESTNVTIAFTSVNLLVVLAVVVSSLGYLDTHNWRLSKAEVPAGYGEGGFLPYGWSGVLAGSATCFFGFIGFDTIASSAEEAKNPKRNVPLSILLSLFISFVAYMAIALVQTLLWPYYDQNKVTILPYIFGRLNMPITYWVVLLGAIAGLASSQLGGMYPLPRILYSMANDRLIYGWLSHINPKLKLPVRATILGSVLIALLACLLDIQDLADMVSIGTLAAYSLVALSVLILRYEDRSDAVDDSTIISNRLSFTDILSTMEPSAMRLNDSPSKQLASNQLKTSEKAESGQQEQESSLTLSDRPKLSAKPSTPIREKGSRPVVAQLSVGFHSWFKASDEEETDSGEASLPPQVQRPDRKVSKGERQPGYLDLLISWRAGEQLKNRPPDDRSSRQSKILISIIVILSIILDLVALGLTNSSLASEHPIATTLNRQTLVEPKLLLATTGSIVLVVLAAVLLMLSRLPTTRSMKENMFQVPLVPLIPTLSIFVNTFLMLNLSYLTWVRFTVWMTFGLFIYLTYGIWNSQGYLLYLDR